MNTNDVIIVSDLHLSPERDRGLFQADAELASFLRWIAEDTVGPCRVVLAGDFIDLLVPPPGEDSIPAFDPGGAARRTQLILDRHPEVFDALARLATSGDHELVFLGGNHDPELVLPQVQETIEARLSAVQTRPFVRWLVNGEANLFTIGGARILVEHGDLYDDWNRIDRNALRLAVSRISRGLLGEHGYQPPPGSRLVVEHLQSLRSRYPWVDSLKPEREAVFPLLHAFLPPTEQVRLIRALRHWLATLRRSFVTEVLRQYRPVAIVRSAADDRRQQLRSWLDTEAQGTRRDVPDLSFDRLIPRLRRVSAENSYFDLEAVDSNCEEVSFLLAQGVDLIVHGHTHAAKAYLVGEGLYLNAGTWGRLLALPGSEAPDKEWRDFLEHLARGEHLGATHPTFVRIRLDPDERATDAALLAWRSGGPTVEARFRFEPLTRHWNQEI